MSAGTSDELPAGVAVQVDGARAGVDQLLGWWGGRLPAAHPWVAAFSVADAVVTEGNAGSTTQAVLTVSRSGSWELWPDHDVKVRVTTADGTAQSSSDYVHLDEQVTFGRWESTKQVTVTINGDDAAEGDEAFAVLLYNANGSTGLPAGPPGTVAIQNDDNALSISDVSVTEGATSKLAVFSVTLAPANPNATVTVDYATADGSATAADGDYVATSGSLVFNPGATQHSVAVPVKGDTKDEADEAFFLRLSNPSSAVVQDGEGQATIVDDDAPPVVALSVNDVVVNENNVVGPVATFTVRLSQAVTDQAVSVDYLTSDGTATSPDDYTPSRGTLIFRPYTTSLTVSVPVNSDLVDEPDEVFYLNLVNASTNASLADGQGMGTIVDDDPPPSA